MPTIGSRRWVLRRLTPVLMLVLVVFVVSAPSAHAVSWFDIGKIAADAILDAILAVLNLLNQMLGQALVATQKALLWILTLKITAGVTVVGEAWSIIRDLVNMVFILLFIVISFATIFNVTGALRQYYWKQALVPLLIGAIVLNYSLAIGQAVSLLSNRIAAIAVGLLPDPGNLLISALKPNATVLTLKNYVGPSSAKIVDTTKSLTAAEDAHYKKCLNEEKTVQSDPGPLYIRGIGRFLLRSVTFGTAGNPEKVRKSVGDCNLEVQEARNAVAAKAVGEKITDEQRAALESHQQAYTTFSGSADAKGALIAAATFNIFMMVLVIACLVTAFIFLAVRILVVWALLALSPLAWMGYALPGKGPFNQWWTTFIAWNVFGPLYIFTLIPGMYMLIKQGDLLTALNQSGAGAAGGLVQMVLFQGFALLIFVGGLGLALKSSFAGAVKGTAFAGAALQKFGTFDTTGGGLAAWRQIGRRTGVTAAAQARLEKAKQQAGDFATGARARMGRFGRTEAESLAEARAARGVRGGAEEVESLRAKRITAERGKMEQQLKINRAKWEAEGRPSDEINELEDDYLRGLMDSKNPDLRLASRELLMNRTRIDPNSGEKIPAMTFDDLAETADDYTRISPLARSAFVERASTRLTEKIDKKEFRNPAELEQAFASGMFTEQQKDKMLRSLARSQPLIASGLLESGNPAIASDFARVFPGKSAMDIIANNFSQLSNADVAKLVERGPSALNPAVIGAIAGRASKLDRFTEIVGTNPSIEPALMGILNARGVPTPTP